jgi:putative ABC transport system substrate-binding protein
VPSKRYGKNTVMKRRDFITLLGCSVAFWPLTTRGQPRKVPVIGWLTVGPFGPNSPNGAAFRQGLAGAGYAAGQDVEIEFRSAGYQLSLLSGLAADLVDRKVAVIITSGSPACAIAAKAATPTIPVVFVVNEDPRKYGLVGSLNRPEANVTGMNFFAGELTGKRLNLLLELIPKTTTIACLLGPPGVTIFEDRRKDILAAAQALGRDVIVVPVYQFDFDTAFATIVQRGAGALIVGDYTSFADPTNRRKILELAARHNIPAIYADARFAADGGLISYGTDFAALFHELGANYVGRILKGAKPADLPVQQPTKFELVINLKTAKALGLRIPRVLLAAATQVIE